MGTTTLRSCSVSGSIDPGRSISPTAFGYQLENLPTPPPIMRGAYVLRMIGGGVGKFSSWYPKAVGLIDRPGSMLPDTLQDRSVVVPMQRARAADVRPKFPRHQPVPELATLRDGVSRWVLRHFAALRALGGGALLAADDLNDRARDNWHQLMAIARAAGGNWEPRARQASLVLSAGGETEQLIELLDDVRRVFDAEGTDAIRSVTLTARLVALEGSQWKDARLNPTRLAKMLRPLGIRKQQLWTDRKQNKNGYRRAQFEDAFG